MRTSADWDQIFNHVGTQASSPPWAVFLTVAALVGNDGIKASWVDYKPAEPTTWTVSLVTEAKRLAYVQLQFKAERYDSDEDRRNPVDDDLNAAWIRPLSNVVKLQIGRIGMLVGRVGAVVGAGNDWFPVGDVQLTFVDGELVTLSCDQGEIDRAQRDRSDRFLEAVRSGVGF
jgi:hypothetical protein